MSFIEIHHGCTELNPCKGPLGDYATIFGSELKFLIGHFLIALILGLLTMSILYRLNKKNKINISTALMIIVSILTIIILFFLFALLFPVRIMY